MITTHSWKFTHEYYRQDQVTAVRDAREFRTLSNRLFSFTAPLPGYGPDFHEISAEAWPKVVHSLRTVTLVLNPGQASSSGIARRDQPSHPSSSRVPRSASGGKLFVETISGEILTLKIRSFQTVTVADLHEHMQDKDGIPVADQRLIFCGQRLESDRTLQECGLDDESTIRQIRCLRGGKPVIYLFPPHTLVDTSIILGLAPSWPFSAVYPTPKVIHSEDSLQTIRWTVDAQPDGVLVDKANGLELSYLFWEAHTNPALPLSPPTSRPSTPFSDEMAPFDPARPKLTPHGSVLLSVEKLPPYLDHVLKALSLHTEARNSFITYWLPSLLEHKYVALRFLPQEVYESTAPMTVTPAPDVVTRIFMLFKGVKQHDLEAWGEAKARATHDVGFWKEVVGVDVERAEDRSLFRVLEWGGMEVM